MEKWYEARTRRDEERRKYSKMDKRAKDKLLGHLEKLEEDRMPKKIFAQELEGTTRRGRPRKRWKQEVKRDLQVLGVRRWRELVADRTKPTVGCSANGRRRRRRSTSSSSSRSSSSSISSSSLGPHQAFTMNQLVNWLSKHVATLIILKLVAFDGNFYY